ncbi:MAG TPA: pyridoxal phosphate-dependent aminotransferase [Candidatus Sulfotelmatobacter sp.]|nr:pyridoxal phosphate-dependent aminotransferase [Candidatus Sulfotelmatobacter sp.]
MPDARLFAFSRRSFLHLSAAASSAAALHFLTEPMLSAAARPTIPKDAIIIDQNENPLGPSQPAREAISAIIPHGGRYSAELTEQLEHTFAEIEGLKPESLHAYPGSSTPLYQSVMAFTSPQKSYVTADPGYEAGMFAAKNSGARVVKVPLTREFAHDVKAMLAAAPDAGLFYIASPNNPTGTLTSHSDIEYLVENKPRGSVVMVDEAYIHFSSNAASVLDLVKADKDVIVLRTFSKIYGMAGLRCGFAIAKPALLEKITDCSGWNFMPTTAVVAAMASLKDAQLVPERRKINADIRQQTFAWLDRNGYSYIPSESNCFLLDTKRPGKGMIDAMAAQKIMIGRIWPVLPTYVRITVGTQSEMEQFQAAFQRIMKGSASNVVPAPNVRASGTSSRPRLPS